MTLLLQLGGRYYPTELEQHRSWIIKSKGDFGENHPSALGIQIALAQELLGLSETKNFQYGSPVFKISSNERKIDNGLLKT